MKQYQIDLIRSVCLAHHYLTVLYNMQIDLNHPNNSVNDNCIFQKPCTSYYAELICYTFETFNDTILILVSKTNKIIQIWLSKLILVLAA